MKLKTLMPEKIDLSVLDLKKSQINKINKRLKQKGWNIELYSMKPKIVIHYKTISPTEQDEYYKSLLHSIIVNNDNFDDIYYSII